MAAALRLGPALGFVISYDERVLDAARRHGVGGELAIDLLLLDLDAISAAQPTWLVVIPISRR